MVGGTIRRKLIHRESFRVSVLHLSEIQAVLQSIATMRCVLTTPSFLSNGTPHHLETDANGDAHFILPKPAPAQLGVRVHLTSKYWHCACVALVTTEDVVKKGIVQPYEPTASAIPLQVEPGEILFVVRPFTFLEHLLYPFVKE